MALKGIGALCIGFWGAWIATRHLRISALESANRDLFYRFNNPTARSQRFWIYCHCLDLIDRGKLPIWAKSETLPTLEEVCDSFDWACYLVKQHLLRKKDAAVLYGDSLIRCWVVLHPWIDHMRERRENDKLWKYFENLVPKMTKVKPFRYWRREGVPIDMLGTIIRIDFEKSKVKDPEVPRD